jgi:hypothetical protein
LWAVCDERTSIIKILKEESMRRVLFVGLALVVLLIGAGIFAWTANALTSTTQANPISAPKVDAVTAGKLSIQEPVQAVPASNVMYDGDVESELVTSSKYEGHDCESGY